MSSFRYPQARRPIFFVGYKYKVHSNEFEICCQWKLGDVAESLGRGTPYLDVTGSNPRWTNLVFLVDKFCVGKYCDYVRNIRSNQSTMT